MFRLDRLLKLGAHTLTLNEAEVEKLYGESEITKKVQLEVAGLPEIILISKTRTFRTRVLETNRAELTLHDRFPLTFSAEKNLEVVIFKKTKEGAREQIIAKAVVDPQLPVNKIRLQDMSFGDYQKLSVMLGIAPK